MECRLCLRFSPPESSTKIYGGTKPLVKFIWNCCQLKVENDDGLPDTICLSCESNLVSFVDFRNFCIQSDGILRRRLNDGQDLKVEEVILDDLVWNDERLPANCDDIDELSEGQSNEGNVVNTLKPTNIQKTQNIRFEPTQKNGVVLINEDGFCYLRHSSAKNKDIEYWKCDRKGKCSGRGVSKNHRREFQQTREHNHLPNSLRLEMRQIQNRVKQAASNAIDSSTTTNILEAALSTSSDAAKARLPNSANLKRNIQRLRNNAQVPLPLPQTRDEIDIPSEFLTTGNTNRSENFLLWDSGPTVGVDERILIFGTEKNLEFLRSCEGILMNGMFKTSLPFFTQLYTIHGTRLEGSDRKPGKAVPLIFMLLPDKTRTTYVRVFAKLKIMLPRWEPQRVMVDFEKAAISVVRTQWPNAQITSCFFHLKQNIGNKIKELGLSQVYNENTENSTKFKLISALAFVPPENVIHSWEELLEILQPWLEIQSVEIQQKIDDLLLYFESNYIGKTIGGVRREARVAPIEIWNVWRRTLEHYGKTDTEVEEFHLKFVHTPGAQYPNLWKFLKLLQGIQAETEKLVEESNSGLIGSNQRMMYIRLEEKIRNITAAWADRQNLETYLRELSYNFSQ